MKPLKYFKALSDITRLRLLNILLHHELSVNEIVSLMGMGQSRISRHLKILTEAGFLECRRDGAWAFYFISSQGQGRAFIDSIKHMLDEETLFKEDLLRAKHIVQDRSLKTMQFFNQIAFKWDMLKREILGKFDLSHVIIQEVPPCNVAVDLGCGTGELLEKMQSVAKQVIGVDSSSKMLEEARHRLSTGNENIDLRLGEIEHLPLRNEEVDCAVISMVLHYISSPDLIMTELARVLRKKGTLIIADYDKHTDENMRLVYGDRWLGFSKDEIEALLPPHGFRIKKFQSFGIENHLTLNIYTIGLFVAD
ncbi:MAG: metalloregulator ArsR/SmtB family transcription factor [Deltaproteobacteria bacterium]|nr:metalloregulator ArsR/SmtB family transcription factor [Deltaproteobacteria bacterium]